MLASTNKLKFLIWGDNQYGTDLCVFNPYALFGVILDLKWHLLKFKNEKKI